MRLPQIGSLAVCFIAALATTGRPARAEAGGGDCSIHKVYSANGRFSLRSVPFSSGRPSLRGKSAVYRVGEATPLYTLDRPFDKPYGTGGVFLGDDGRVIVLVLGWAASDQVPGLKSVSVYMNGSLLRDFTMAEVTGCDLPKERCGLVYSNYDKVVDRERSQFGTSNYHRVFKDGVGDEERFLSDYAVFASPDAVYLTDSNKMVHRFSLADGSRLPDQPFLLAYPEMRRLAKETKDEEEAFQCEIHPEFPRLVSGQKAEEHLAATLGLQAVKETYSERYRLHLVFVEGVLWRDGRFDVEELTIRGSIDREKVSRFFAEERFDTKVIPAPCDSWYFRISAFSFRNRSEAAARRERQEEILEEKREIARRQALEAIDGVYIPKDLGGCFLELDKRLSDIDKEEMRAKPKAEDMIEYHFGLGMGLRNSWGLWRGSRLQKYFADRGIEHPDSMSGIILHYYWGWLHGDKEEWKNWEKTWREPRPPPPPPPPKKK